MIMDSLDHIHRYTLLTPQIQEAMDWLASHDITQMEPGLYQIDGERLMVKVQHYTTVPKEERALEYHRRYIDLQCEIQGNEMFGVCRLSDLTDPGEYLPERDVAFPSGSCHYLPLREGHFFLAFPGEVHQTKCLYQNTPAQVWKAIFKLTPPSGENGQ